MTNVVRGAGRARHQANAKHQQRTPLPPKNGPQRTPTDLAEEAAETRAAVTRPKRVVKAQEEPAEPRLSKAQEFALYAEAAGWKVERSATGETKTVHASRPNGSTLERVQASWVNDKSALPLGYHEVAGINIKLIHVSVAKRILDATPEESLAKAQAAKPARAERTETRLRIRKIRLPFDPDTATDEEVMRALEGKRVRWTNSFAGVGELEEALIPQRTWKDVTTVKDGVSTTAPVQTGGKLNRIDPPAGLGEPCDRMVTFAGANGEGFRSFRLSAIVQVGR